MEECLIFENFDEIIAVEGVFIRLSLIDYISRNWQEVQEPLEGFMEEVDDENVVKHNYFITKNRILYKSFYVRT